jgi:hypothetical protein
MSPEQVREEIDTRSDVFSFATGAASRVGKTK